MRLVRSSPVVAITACLAVVLAACGSSGVSPTSAQSPTAPPIPSFDGLVIDLVAKGQEFSKKELEVPAGAPFRILLDNQDKDFPHGVAIGTGGTAAEARVAKLVYEGEIVAGPVLNAYDIPALAPGKYWFFCQPHANMNGTIAVE
ncbi:MAG TPA: cupredoxin domain-containing protein [Candidatus Eisenbacteria bacterium]|nr:cupredoxin domain-containing protein [Candidatus Eisenbacteria bacterium]